MFYIECIDATTQQLLLRLLTGCCYALRSTQLANTLPSLMLRSKICASFFQASTIIDATPYDLLFNFQIATDLQFSTIIDATLKSSLQVSNISHSTLKDLLNCPTLLMLRCQIPSSRFRHHRCCALRFLLFFPHILPALMLCFSILFPCSSHCTIIDAML